ncbi:PDR/VanB family oxidoreductase [Actinomadura sp. SCN-SB]|uniref:PDR/VanB family oxidoreductase n=1 Tax=Actinomadura sp. SCN-SB TaxID=3373092 RepID=UPI00374FF0AF
MEAVGDGVLSFALAPPGGRGLPPFVPGSHLVVHCGERRRNAYSLTGSGAPSAEYRISVLGASADGGSAWMHRLSVGDEVKAEGPRSAFPPVATARHHLLIAGGIGVTPLLSHTRAAVEWGRSFTLFYAHRTGAHADELRELCGERLREFSGRDEFTVALRDALRSQPLGTHAYVCGPSGLIDAVRGLAAEAGWPDQRIHVERFSADDLEPGRPFTARLARSGIEVEVPSGVSLLEALERAGVEVPHMCRQGVCGECRVGVLSGRPEHRDLFLSEGERAAGDAMMCCVSRALDGKVEVDL